MPATGGRCANRIRAAAAREVGWEDDENRKEFLAVTHVLSPVPIEIHSFLSLLHDVPLYVLTSDGVWSVSSGEIRHLGGLEELGLREKAP